MHCTLDLDLKQVVQRCYSTLQAHESKSKMLGNTCKCLRISGRHFPLACHYNMSSTKSFPIRRSEVFDRACT